MTSSDTVDASSGPGDRPLTLSTPEFLAQVLALRPRVAVFDCDGTLWSGDAGSGFMRWTMETGLLSAERAEWLTQRYEAYGSGQVSELAICGEMVQVYAGLPIRDLREAAATYFRDFIQDRLFAELAELIGELQRRGADLWMVSSTCDWVIEEGVQRFGIGPDRVLAARVETEAGLATSRLVEVPTDEDKVRALNRRGITAPDVVFGNSVHDAAMLRLARQAFPVNPSPELATEAAARGWPVYFPLGVRG